MRISLTVTSVCNKVIGRSRPEHRVTYAGRGSEVEVSDDAFFGASTGRKRRSAIGQRCLLGAAVLFAGLLYGQTSSQPAHATWDYCRTDPIVHLTDGTMLKLTSTIQDPASDVQGIAYTIHAPRGVEIARVVFTGDSLSSRETVVVVHDGAPAYATDTLVSTAIDQAAVSTTLSIPSLGSAWGRGTSGISFSVSVAA